MVSQSSYVLSISIAAIIVAILFLTFMIIDLNTASVPNGIQNETGDSDSQSNCKVVSIVNALLSGTDPKEASDLCISENLSVAECGKIFNDFFFYNLKNGIAGSTDPNSAFNKVFFGYLGVYQPQAPNSAQLGMIYEHFQARTPIDDVNNEYPGLNAILTRNKSYCDFKTEIDAKEACLSEVTWLNANSTEDCAGARNYGVYLICIQEKSAEAYESEIGKCMAG